MKKSIIIISVLFFFIVFTVFMIKKNSTQAQAKVHEIFQGVDNNKIIFIIDQNTLINVDVQIKNKKIYIPLDIVVENIDSQYNYDKRKKTLSYQPEKSLLTTKLGSNILFIDDIKKMCKYDILIDYDKKTYIALSFVATINNFKYKTFINPHRIMIETRQAKRSKGEINQNNTFLRIDPTKKSKVIKTLSENEKVSIYHQKNDWYYISTQTGWLGYIKNDSVHKIEPVIISNQVNMVTSIANEVNQEKRLDWKNIPIENEEDITNSNINNPTTEVDYSNMHVETPQLKGKINMVWDQVTAEVGYGWIQKKMQGIKGVTVISPTWFQVQDESGKIKSLANKGYVNWAHANGYQVWAMLDNKFNKDITKAVCSDPTKRQYMIEQLVHYCKTKNVDGINSDFEHFGVENSGIYVTFIKELYQVCQKENIILSVAVGIPNTGFGRQFDTKALGQVADYIMVMTYNEHYVTGKRAGSTASYGFVENSIKNTIKLGVPKQKIVIGLPLYTTHWKESTDGISGKELGMTSAKNFVLDNNIELSWDDTIKQHYGEYTDDEARHRIWLEDEKSIAAKMSLVKKYDVNGVSWWKIGLDKEGIFDVITKYLK